MPTSERLVPAGLIHPDHLGPPKIAAKPGLRFAEAGNWHPWVVKLKFVQGSEASGTGFFINLPGASCDVILTAGHNLVDSSGNPSTGIVVLEAANGSTELRETPVTSSDVRVSKRYLKRPNDSNAANDYGAILLRRDGVGDRTPPPRPGFGFSLLLGIDHPDLLSGKDPKDEYLTSCGVTVTGYRADTPPGKPDVSTGACTILPNQLEYSVLTQVGLSGSPVWTSYEGLETVVAVHNHGQKGLSKNSSGTRLTLSVMQEVFCWAEVGLHLNKRIRVEQRGAHHEGLYLAFTAEGGDGKFAGRVHVGQPPADKADMLSAFDVVLAEAPPTTRLAERQQRYALRVKHYWLLWDVRSRRITLSSQFHPWCFVRLENVDNRGSTFHIVIYREEENLLVRLKVDILGLTEQHLMMGKRDVNGISFPKAIVGKVYKFDQFCLE